MTPAQERLLMQLRDLRRLTMAHGAAPTEFRLPRADFRMFRRAVKTLGRYRDTKRRHPEYMGIKVVEDLTVPTGSFYIVEAHRPNFCQPKS